MCIVLFQNVRGSCYNNVPILFWHIILHLQQLCDNEKQPGLRHGETEIVADYRGICGEGAFMGMHMRIQFFYVHRIFHTLFFTMQLTKRKTTIPLIFCCYAFF